MVNAKQLQDRFSKNLQAYTSRPSAIPEKISNSAKSAKGISTRRVAYGGKTTKDHE